MPRPRFWTEERLNEIRRFYNLDYSHQQMADELGVTLEALRGAIKVYKLGSRSRDAFKRSVRMKGRKESAETRAKKADAMRRRHAGPIEGQRLKQIGALAGRKVDRRKAWATRRGFDVPDHHRTDYRALRRKKFSAREAGAILGLIPQPSAIGA